MSEAVKVNPNTAMLEKLVALGEQMRGELALLRAEVAAMKTTPRAAPSGGEGTFPNYGGAKGQSIIGASMKDLAYYANGAKRSLEDPSKERFHQKEAKLLALIEAEIARQQGGEAPPHDDADAPPPTDAPF
jgi:hypothetical protein